MASTKAVKTFKELTDKLPYSPTTSTGKGFLPIFLRGMGHLLYSLGRIVDSKDDKSADKSAFIQTEIKDAMSHFSGVEVNSAFSSAAKDNLVTFNLAVEAFDREFSGWTDQERIDNLRALVNKGLAISATLDRELIGLRNSDPGSSL